jgi:hypothetical protein
MTPKEKAKELCDKIHLVLPSYADEGQQEHKSTKECALIAVDEILNALSYKISSNFEEIQYYVEVKQEIEKL